MKKALAAAVGAVLLISLTACGDGGSDKDAKPELGTSEKEVAKNIADSFSTGASGSLTADEATCFADQFVDEVGLEKLESSKLIDDKGKLNQQDAKFDKELATDFAESFLGCVDYQKKQAEVIAGTDPKIDAAKLEACLAKAMPEDYVTKLIVASYTQTTESAALLQESTKKLETCKTSSTAKK